MNQNNKKYLVEIGHSHPTSKFYMKQNFACDIYHLNFHLLRTSVITHGCKHYIYIYQNIGKIPKIY